MVERLQPAAAAAACRPTSTITTRATLPHESTWTWTLLSGLVLGTPSVAEPLAAAVAVPVVLLLNVNSMVGPGAAPWTTPDGACAVRPAIAGAAAHTKRSGRARRIASATDM